MNKEKIKLAGKAVVPSLLTFIICMGVLAVKQIYPFGAERIDYYDMGQTNAPLYYHIYDFLHGKVSLFFDWYINQGQNLSMGSAIQWNISPFNLFFLFVKRDMILQSLSLFTVLRLVFMSFTMYLLLHNTVKKLPYFYHVVFSVLYSLCGYSLIHYTIPTYLDMAVFAPLLVWSLYRLLKEGKTLFYTLMLGYTIALSYYLGFMNLIFILMVSGLYLFLILSRDQRADRAVRLAAGTVGGLGISCVMLIPAVFQMMKSTRFNSNLSQGAFETIVSIMNSIGADMYYIKWWLLFGMELPAVIILMGLFFTRKDVKRNLFILLAVFVPCALIPFESINILWHFGTYYHYPVRCGYLIPLAILLAAGYYCSVIYEEKTWKRKQNIVAAAGVIAGIAGAFLLLSAYLRHERWYVKELFPLSVIFFLVLFAAYFVLSAAGKGKFREFAVCFLVFELVTGAFISYGVPHYYTDYSEDPEQSGEYILDANAIRDALPIEESFIDRIKNPDTNLNTNYSMVLNRATLTGWANTVQSEQQDAAIRYGYGAHFMRILDSGGTYFTDSLLNVKDIITCVPFEEDHPVYRKTAEGAGYMLYKNTMALPFGLTVSQDLLASDIYNMDIVQIHNLLYRTVSGKDHDIAAYMVPQDEQKRAGSSSFRLNVEGEKALYLYQGDFSEITVNGETVLVPSIGEPDNRAYPAWFNSNVVCIGNYKDEELVIEADYREADQFRSRLFALDLELLRGLSLACQEEAVAVDAGKNTLALTVNGDAQRNMLLLPVNYDKGFRVTVNGKETNEVHRAAGLFTGILLEEGENRIEMKFTPPGLKVGVLISMLTLLLSGILVWMNRRKEILIPAAVKTPVKYLFEAVWWLAGAALYVIPVCWFVVHVIVKRL